MHIFFLLFGNRQSDNVVCRAVHKMQHIQAGWFNVLACVNEKLASVPGVGFEITFLGSEQ